MTLEQLNTLLEGTLTELDVSEPNDMQSALIARVKQGGDAVIITDRTNDPLTGISFVSVMKAPKAFEGSPRVLVLSPTIDSVHVLHKQLTECTRRTEIAVEFVSRLAEILPKCQRIIIPKKITPRVEKMIELLCVNPKVMEFENPEA